MHARHSSPQPWREHGHSVAAEAGTGARAVTIATR